MMPAQKILDIIDLDTASGSLPGPKETASSSKKARVPSTSESDVVPDAPGSKPKKGKAAKVPIKWQDVDLETIDGEVRAPVC